MAFPFLTIENKLPKKSSQCSIPICSFYQILPSSSRSVWAGCGDSGPGGGHTGSGQASGGTHQAQEVPGPRATAAGDQIWHGIHGRHVGQHQSNEECHSHGTLA